MFAAHLAAAGVIAWWLRWGERAAGVAVGRILNGLRPFMTGAVGDAPPRIASAATTWVRARRVWGAGLAGRSPPMLRVLLALTA